MHYEDHYVLMEENKQAMTYKAFARLRSAVGSVSDSRARGLGFDTQSCHILSFLLLTQEGQLSVTGESMCTKYRLTA